MNNRKSKWALLLLSSASCLFISSAANCQESGADEVTDNDAIVVTATRRELLLKDVPASISAIGAQQLEDLGAREVQDYILTVPGVSFTDIGGGRQQIVFRGVAALGSNATTAVYLDETPLAIDLRLFDVERVEVLRGPQGTLYGTSAMGGALRTITRKPNASKTEFRFAGSVNSVAYGGIGHDLNAMANLPIAEDKLALRIVAYREIEAGFVDNFASDRSVDPVVLGQLIEEHPGDHVTEGTRTALRFDASDALDLTLTHIWQRDIYKALNSEDTDLGIEALRQSRNFNERFGSRVHQFNGTLNYRFGFADLISSTTWSIGRDTSSRDVTIVYSPIVQALAGALTGADTSGVRPLFLGSTDRNRNFTQEVRLTSSGDDRFDWLVGAYYNRYHSAFAQRIIGPGSQPLFDLGAGLDLAPGDQLFAASVETSQRELSFFAEGKLAIGDALDATVGVRRYHIESAFAQSTTGLFAFTGTLDSITGNTVSSGTASKTGLTYRFNLAYRAGADTLFYAQAASGYRQGGANSFIPAGETPTPVTQYDPDTLWQYELGFRTTLFDRKLSINGAMFYIDWSGIQAGITTQPTGYSFVGNVGKADVKGAEVELAWKVFDGLNVNAAATYTDARFREGLASLDVDKGDPIADIPRFTGSFGAQYEWKLSDAMTANAGANVTHVSERVTNANTGTGLNGYDKVDLRVGLDWKRVSVGLFVRNLLDVRGQLGRDVLLGYERRSYTPPRTIGASLSFDM